jgi:hypothetical protein
MVCVIRALVLVVVAKKAGIGYQREIKMLKLPPSNPGVDFRRTICLGSCKFSQFSGHFKLRGWF